MRSTNEAAQIAETTVDGASSLVPVPAGPVVPLLPPEQLPMSQRMADPEQKIRSGQFRSDPRLARHTAHRPYEPD